MTGISIYPPIVSPDFGIKVSLGEISGYYAVGRFGKAPSGVQTTETDFWARADSTPTQQIWLAPTAARIHTIASTSVNDTTGGTGANSVIVTYLPDWDTAETTETVTGNLNAGIAMNNAAVMINRMEVVPQSTSTTANAGVITATAATDATVTAVIRIGKGRTEQAIIGVPSTQSFLVTDVHASLNDNAVGSRVDVSLLVNPSPDVNPVIFLNKGSFELQASSTSNTAVPYDPPRKFAGPCIAKLNGIASTNDLDCSGIINGYLADN